MEVYGQLHAPVNLLPGERAFGTNWIRLGGPQIRFGRGGKERKTLSCSFRELNSSRPVRSLLTILTELHLKL
jgi:hypothetical protein